MIKILIKTTRLMALSAACAALISCATKNEDPFEGYNRAIFKFNQGVDKVVYRPLAKTYDTVTPDVMQKGITNFYNNLYDVTHLANDLLQLNLTWAVSDFWRIFFNTTLGVGGLFDVATTHMNLQRHDQDFGITLAKYGMRKSPYFLIPFFAPGTFRDQVAFFVDYGYLSVYPYIQPKWTQYSVYGLNLINQRAKLLPADKLVEEAFDPYIFVRDAFLQKRRQQIQRALHPTLSEDELEDLLSGEGATVPLDDDLSLDNKNSATASSDANMASNDDSGLDSKTKTNQVAQNNKSSQNDGLDFSDLDNKKSKSKATKTNIAKKNKSSQDDLDFADLDKKTNQQHTTKAILPTPTINTTVQNNKSADTKVIDGTPANI